MNISNWPLGNIMQLPDHMFGRRFLISCADNVSASSTVWNISEISLPEMTVIWELFVLSRGFDKTRTVIRLALGDQLPADVGMMSELEPLLPGLGFDGPEPRYIHFRDQQMLHLNNLKHPVRTAGRRLVVEFENTYTISTTYHVQLVVSSVPREIPDCLISV